MAYTFSKAANVLKIAEQEYGSASEIMFTAFTAFTSCVGVVARKDNTLTATHLVMFAKDESPFDANAAVAALALLPDKADDVVLIGHLTIWDSDKRVNGAHQKLASGLKSLTKVQQYPFGNGTYGAKVTADGIEPTYEF